jgi:hypothetical protein
MGVDGWKKQDGFWWVNGRAKVMDFDGFDGKNRKDFGESGRGLRGDVDWKWIDGKNRMDSMGVLSGKHLSKLQVLQELETPPKSPKFSKESDSQRHMPAFLP